MFSSLEAFRKFLHQTGIPSGSREKGSDQSRRKESYAAKNEESESKRVELWTRQN